MASQPVWRLTVVTALVVLACLALGWWQVTRAASGNLPSYVYSVMWPFFAGYACYVWHRLRRPSPPPHRADTEPGQGASDARHAAYNRYLAQLRTSRSGGTVD
ncbi:MAG: hypothetical protein ACRDS0_28045 [Pseudonocardiaceae bacterium]